MIFFFFLGFNKHLSEWDSCQGQNRSFHRCYSCFHSVHYRVTHPSSVSHSPGNTDGVISPVTNLSWSYYTTAALNTAGITTAIHQPVCFGCRNTVLNPDWELLEQVKTFFCFIFQLTIFMHYKQQQQQQQKMFLLSLSECFPQISKQS